MAKNKGDKIIIKGLGGSVTGVTGSCWKVTYPTKSGNNESIILECGMIQGSPTLLSDYNANKDMLDGIDFTDVKYIFFMHPHIDHIGLIPAAFNKKFDGRIIATKEGIDIADKLLKDSAFIHGRNVKALQSKGKQVKPLYIEQDVYLAINKMDAYCKNEIHQLNEYVSFRFVNNGHVLSATQLELYIRTPSSTVKKLLYSSDLGFDLSDQPFVDKNHIVTKANIALFESTYGHVDRSFTKEMIKKEREDLVKTIKRYTSNKKRVLIPAFSFGRSQYLMEFIYRNFKDDKSFKDVMVVIDSNLTNNINATYTKILTGENKDYWEEIMAWKNFKFIKEYKDTEIIIAKKDTPMVILSSSGMGSNGRVTSYIKSILPNKSDCIIWCGYCSTNTLGRKIQNENQKTVTIDGLPYAKRCKIKSYRTFSSHIQLDGIINYFKNLHCDKIILHHGEPEAKDYLKNKAKEELYKCNMTTKIVCADQHTNEFMI